MDLRVNDRVKLKKPHPCGSYEWIILRTGIDFRIKCNECGHEVMITRKNFEKRVKSIIRDGEQIK